MRWKTAMDPASPAPRRSARRAALRTLALAFAPLIAAAPCAAQEGFPSKPVRIVVQYAAGGSSDTIARLLGDKLSPRLGQPVLIENRAGAGGIIGTDYVAKSAPDGYTLLMTVPGPVTANLALYKKLPYDPRTDLRMVSDIAVARTVLAVNPSVPAKDFKSLIAAIQAAPNTYAMGSWGPGTQAHQVQVFMDKSYGTRMLHVPYKGEAPMVTDLVAGQIQMAVGSVATLKPYIAAGKLRALAVFGPDRAKPLPELPTFVEQGFKDEVYTMTAPISLMAPAKTPDAVVERLGREVAAAVHDAELQRRIEELGAEPVGNAPAQAAAAYQALLPVVLRTTRATGVTLD